MCFTDDTSVYFSQNDFPFFPSSMMLLTHIYDSISYSSVVKWLRVWVLFFCFFFSGCFKKKKKKMLEDYWHI